MSCFNGSIDALSKLYTDSGNADQLGFDWRGIGHRRSRQDLYYSPAALPDLAIVIAAFNNSTISGRTGDAKLSGSLDSERADVDYEVDDQFLTHATVGR